jgi:hypothetical protein
MPIFPAGAWHFQVVAPGLRRNAQTGGVFSAARRLPVLASAWELFAERRRSRGGVVTGRFPAIALPARRELGPRIAIVNVGPTRADQLAPCARLHAQAGGAFSVAERLGIALD